MNVLHMFAELLMQFPKVHNYTREESASVYLSEKRINTCAKAGSSKVQIRGRLTFACLGDMYVRKYLAYFWSEFLTRPWFGWPGLGQACKTKHASSFFGGVMATNPSRAACAKFRTM